MSISSISGVQFNNTIQYVKNYSLAWIFNLFTKTSIVKRPWGTYETIHENDEYKVKKIMVLPHHRLSLQSHNHRSEHWVIVSGRGNVQLGDEFSEVQKNSHIYISKHQKHRIENVGDDMLVFIETQLGDYLGEDDIIRYEDDYKRKCAN